MLKKSGWCLPKEEVQIQWDKLLGMNWGIYSKDNGPETEVVQTLRKHWWRDGLYRLAFIIGRRARMCNFIEDGDKLLKFWEGASQCRYSSFTLANYDCKGNKVIGEEEALTERYGQRIFSSGCFGPKEKARFTNVMLPVEERGLGAVWWTRAVLPLRLKVWGGWELGSCILQYMGVNPSLDAGEKNQCGSCVRCFTADDKIPIVDAEDVKNNILKVGERYGLEISSFIVLFKIEWTGLSL